MATLEFNAMGVRVRVNMESDSPRAKERLHNVPEWFEGWEQCLSRFRPTSELSQLNARAGEWVRVSAVLWEVLRAAYHAARTTAGLVSPTLLPALEQAGYRQSFENLSMSGALFEPSLPLADWHTLEFSSSHRTIRTSPQGRVDVGGIAKGWAAERAAQRLSHLGAVVVDVGGDIAIRGWRAGCAIGVAEPYPMEGLLTTLWLTNNGVATSGRDYRKWHVNGQWHHHLIDPRTGRPAVTDVLTATVVGSNALHAEAGAKAALLLGLHGGLAWLDAHSTLAGLLVDDQHNVYASTRWRQYEWRATYAN